MSATETTVSVVQHTAAGDRPNNDGIIQQAQHWGLLDATDPTKLGQALLANPQGVLVNFAHLIFGAVAFSKDGEANTPHPITGEQDLWDYVQRMVAKAEAAGLIFTISLDENGKMVPTIQKAAPATKP
jgi:hypothetical protein